MLSGLPVMLDRQLDRSVFAKTANCLLAACFACVAACSDVLACGGAACSCSCSPCDSAHCLHPQSARRACTAQLRAAAACPASVIICVCVLVTRWCVVWETAQEAHHGHHRVVLVRVAAAANPQPPAQPWPGRGKPLCVVRVSPECPLHEERLRSSSAGLLATPR
jgi:hypothetical protein